jgi:cytochrome c-type biogenesis protein CcmH/NrfG
MARMSMSHRRRASGRSTRSRSYLLPLIAALGIGAILLGLIVALLPIGGIGSESDDPFQAGVQVQITPGGEEARMQERLRQNPEDTDAMVILADLYANTGRGSEAIQRYEQAIQRRPDDASLRVNFGSVLQRYSYNTDAEIQFEKARQLEPTDPEPAYLLGLLYAQSQTPRLDEARAMFQAAIDVAPDSIYAQRSRDQLQQLDEKP